MHPTPEEHLAAVRRLIAHAMAAAPEATEAVAALTDADRILRRLHGSLSARLPFLVEDCRLARELLVSLESELPADLVADLGQVPAEGELTSEPLAHEADKTLRGLLARAVRALPDGPDGDQGRSRIADHLRQRLAADPALQRTPVSRTATPGQDSTGG
jgi:hypothetical protein